MRIFFSTLWMVMLVTAVSGENLLRHGAIISGSGFAGKVSAGTVSGENYYPMLCDDDPTTGWEPQQTAGPHYLEMRWRVPVAIHRMSWDMMRCEQFRLSAWVNGEYREIGVFPGKRGQTALAEFRTSRLRLELVKCSGKPRIFELALAGPAQTLPPQQLPSATVPGTVLLQGAGHLLKGRAGHNSVLEFEAELTTAQPAWGLIEIKQPALSGYFAQHFGDIAVTATALELKPGRHAYQVDLELPPWTPTGVTPLILQAFTTDYSGRLAVRGELGKLTVEGEKAPETGKNPGAGTATLTWRNGHSGFAVNGEFVPPFFHRYMCSMDFERLWKSRDTGIDIQYFILYAATLGTPESRRVFFKRLDQQIRATLAVRPEAMFIIGMDMRASGDWRQRNPNEMMLDYRGRLLGGKATVSYGSPKLWSDSLAYIDDLLAFVAAQPWGARVIGYHPWSCTSLDAFMGGIDGNRGVGDRGKIMIGDFHPGAIAAFREYLRRKYHHDVEQLRQAWKQPDVEFDTALPDGAKLMAGDREQVFRDPGVYRPEIDYIEFFPSLIGNYLRALGQRVKEKTAGQKLFLVHYGAIIHNLMRSQPSGARAHSVNFDLPALLNDDSIDGYVQSVPYDTRHADTPVLVYQPVESLNLHKRLYLFDYDLRTVSAGTLRHGRMRSNAETAAVIRRDFAWMQTHNAGAWLADMSKGGSGEFSENQNSWFAEPPVTGPIRRMRDLALRQAELPRRSAAEIAVILSTETPAYEDALNSAVIYRNLIGQIVQRELPLLPAPYEVILADDLANPALRDDYKLYCFMNVFYLTDKQQQAIEKLKRNGKTLLFFYAPNYVGRHKLGVERIGALTGINTALKPNAEKMTVQLNDGRQFTLDSWSGALHLHPDKIRPVFYVDDPEATVMMRYQDGQTAMAMRDFGSHKVIYSALPWMDRAMLRRCAEIAGVHLYCDEDIVLNVDGNLLAVTNGFAVPRKVKIMLPKPCRVAEVSDEDGSQALQAARTTQEFEVVLGAPETKIFQLQYNR